MTLKSKLIMSAAFLGTFLLVAWPVYAHCGKCASSAKAMIQTMDEGTISLTKAIEAAEKHSKGKAVAAYCELQSDLEIEVYCLAEGKIMEVKVDGTGKVTGMEAVKSLPEHNGDDHDHDH